MTAVVLHAVWCAWRLGGPCTCGGNRNARKPASLTICEVCNDDPCSCERFANADEARA